MKLDEERQKPEWLTARLIHNIDFRRVQVPEYWDCDGSRPIRDIYNAYRELEMETARPPQAMLLAVPEFAELHTHPDIVQRIRLGGVCEWRYGVMLTHLFGVNVYVDECIRIPARFEHIRFSMGGQALIVAEGFEEYQDPRLGVVLEGLREPRQLRIARDYNPTPVSWLRRELRKLGVS